MISQNWVKLGPVHAVPRGLTGECARSEWPIKRGGVNVLGPVQIGGIEHGPPQIRAFQVRALEAGS